MKKRLKFILVIGLFFPSILFLYHNYTNSNESKSQRVRTAISLFTLWVSVVWGVKFGNFTNKNSSSNQLMISQSQAPIEKLILNSKIGNESDYNLILVSDSNSSNPLSRIFVEAFSGKNLPKRGVPKGTNLPVPGLAAPEFPSPSKNRPKSSMSTPKVSAKIVNTVPGGGPGDNPGMGNGPGKGDPDKNDAGNISKNIQKRIQLKNQAKNLTLDEGQKYGKKRADANDSKNQKAKNSNQSPKNELIPRKIHRTIRSRAKKLNDDRLYKEAKKTVKNLKVKEELPQLIDQLKKGNLSPGIDTKSLSKTDRVFYARGDAGTRVFFRELGKGGDIEILAISDKNNETKVIRLVQEIYSKE